jgi:hypothetical protein
VRGRVGHMLITGTLFLLVASTSSAQAAFPGKNGKIAFWEYNGDTIRTIEPDGTGESNIGPGREPRFSPDGTKIVISGPLSIMNVDGTSRTPVQAGVGLGRPAWSADQHQLTGWSGGCYAEANCLSEIDVVNVDGTNLRALIRANTDTTGSVRDPSWSPRGDRIAFEWNAQIWTIRPDGTNLIQVTDGNRYHTNPDWSPDGTRLAVAGRENLNTDVYTMNSDGTGVTRLTTDPGADFWPAWSPNGTKIVFVSSRSGEFTPQVFTMNADGTNQTLLSAIPRATTPDWQPLVSIPGYVRPKSANSVRVPLVPAFTPCTSPNREHGPPLAYGSCNPPAQESSALTVGTGMSGFVRYRPVIGNPATPADEADVAVRVQITDVSEQGTQADYAGAVRAESTARLVDRGSGGPATVVDVLFPLLTQCTPTQDETVGSDCSLNTTLDALIPGAIAEGRRTVLQLDQVSVADGGPDADPWTEPNTVLLRQGLFVP